MLDLVILAQGEQRSPVFISGNLVFLQFFHPKQLIKLYMEPLEMTFGGFFLCSPADETQCSSNIWSPEGGFLPLQNTSVAEEAPLLWSPDIFGPYGEYSLSEVSGLHLQLQLLSDAIFYFPQSAPSSSIILLRPPPLLCDDPTVISPFQPGHIGNVYTQIITCSHTNVAINVV